MKPLPHYHFAKMNYRSVISRSQGSFWYTICSDIEYSPTELPCQIMDRMADELAIPRRMDMTIKSVSVESEESDITVVSADN